MALPSASGQGLALDGRSLAGLRRDAAADPKTAVRQAAGQFEALFMQQLLKSMRAALPKSGLMDGPGQDMYQGMLDQQLSQSLANRRGGLADMIARQLTRQLGTQGRSGGDAAEAQAAAAAGSASRAGIAARPAIARDGLQAAGYAGSAAGAAAYQRAARAAEPFDAEASQALRRSLSQRLDSKQSAFVERMWSHAQAAERSTGVPAAFVVGQAALESGWGKREIKHADGSSAHNLFGIKAGSSWKGATVDVTTTEYVDGQPRKVVERFRAYGSYAEAFQDWSQLMARQSRYAPLLRAGHSVTGFAQGMQRAGYATDPRYGEKLERTINQTLLLKRLTV
ncbi:MAG: flagellar assembly peptidoglycan hydrolase FlgJ [Burkholderiaceae bacterium]